MHQAAGLQRAQAPKRADSPGAQRHLFGGENKSRRAKRRRAHEDLNTGGRDECLPGLYTHITIGHRPIIHHNTVIVSCVSHITH